MNRRPVVSGERTETIPKDSVDSSSKTSESVERKSDSALESNINSSVTFTGNTSQISENFPYKKLNLLEDTTEAMAVVKAPQPIKKGGMADLMIKTGHTSLVIG